MSASPEDRSRGGSEADDLRTVEATRGDVAVTLFVRRALSERDVARIVDQLTGRYEGPRHLSQERTVLLPAETDLPYDGIKLKGAGLRGGRIRFDEAHQVPYALPRYDAEGSYAEDLARGFHRACSGGMSYQQATNEYRIVSWLVSRGFDTLPALGWGSVDSAGRKSWLLVLNAPFREFWDWCHQPSWDADLVREMPVVQARGQVELRRLGVTLALNGVTSVGGRLVRKDLHGARFHDRNDTFVSRAMYELFDVNFCLWNYRDPRAQPGLEEWTERSSRTYVEELTGTSHTMDVIEDFRSFNWIYRDAGLSLTERLALIESNPISRHVLDQHLPESERRPYRSERAAASARAKRDARERRSRGPVAVARRLARSVRARLPIR